MSNWSGSTNPLPTGSNSSGRGSSISIPRRGRPEPDQPPDHSSTQDPTVHHSATNDHKAPPIIYTDENPLTSNPINNWVNSSADLYEDMMNGRPAEGWDVGGVLSKGFVYGFMSPFWRVSEGKWYKKSHKAYAQPNASSVMWGKGSGVPQILQTNVSRQTRTRRKKKKRRDRFG